MKHLKQLEDTRLTGVFLKDKTTIKIKAKLLSALPFLTSDDG
jgi:hypothetical protein